LLLLLAVLLLLGLQPAALSAAGDGAAPPPVVDFGRIDAAQGWALTPCALVWSADAGATWRTLHPPGIDLAAPLAVDFADARRGLLVQMAAVPAGAVTVARTQDGGLTWETHTAPALARNDPAAHVASLHLQMLDAEQGWLLLRRVSSSNFSRGAIFLTRDGGLTWQRRTTPAGEPAVFRNAAQGWMIGADGVTLWATADGARSWQPVALPATQAPLRRVGLPLFAPEGGRALLPVIVAAPSGQERHWYASSDRGASWQPWAAPRSPGDAPAWLRLPAGDVTNAVFATATDGWALGSGRRLLRTHDGGQQWQTVALPACAPVAASVGATIPAPAPALDLVSVGEGAAFDICELPSPGELAAWRAASPYRIVNLYIGGSMRACANRSLHRELLAGLSEAGWRFIPTWVGPQAPCSDYRIKFDAGVTTAFAQGRQEAAQALATAQTLGLTTAEHPGTVIYYDLEAFDDSDATCVAAAQAFVRGWSTELRARGSLAGLYAAACWPGIGLYAQEAPPDAVWMAHWVRPGYDPAVTVWDVPCVANSLWVNQQRIRQYTGGHDETWGEVTLNIDANVANGPVADLTRSQPFTTTVVVEEPVLTPADDGDLCSTAWYRYTNPRGYPAFLTLNRRLGDPPPPIINQATWAPALPLAGVYRVEVYLSEHEAAPWVCPAALLEMDSGEARYSVEHATGTAVQVIDQMAARGGWVDLGVYSFPAATGARLTLSDATGEAQFTVTLSASAARFTLVPAAEAPPQLWLPLIARPPSP
jgi:photosystem II stability/assembly factor-like uncharacterized protein